MIALKVRPESPLAPLAGQCVKLRDEIQRVAREKAPYCNRGAGMTYKCTKCGLLVETKERNRVPFTHGYYRIDIYGTFFTIPCDGAFVEVKP